MYYVYALSSINKKYIYVGLTSNVILRFHRHNNGYEKTTKPYSPFTLIFSIEVSSDRQEARKVEKYYKSGVGKEKLKKILNNPEGTGLSADR